MREKQNMNKILKLAIAVAGSVVISLGSAQADPKGKKVAFLITSPTNPFIAELTKHFVAKASSLGMDVTTFNTPFDVALQSQQVDDAIARKFDMIAIIAAAEGAIVPALTRARDAKVPVIMVNTPPRVGTNDLYLTFVGEDHTELGRIAGQGVVQALKESGRDTARIALITGSLQEGVGPRRVVGFKEALKALPKVQIVATEDAKWDTAASERIAGQLYARFAPTGGLDVLYGMADNQTVAAIKAAEAANIPLGTKKGELIVVGSNCVRQGIEMIKAGKQYSTGVQVPARTGERSAELAADYFNGKSVPKEVILPIELVTKANVEKWEKPCSF
jgi:ABC-type sugar transport system substrate-binding protein